MANENSFPAQVGNRGYYGIDGEGRIFRKATPAEIEQGGKDIVQHVKKKGVNEGQIEMRRTFASIYGKVCAFWVKTSQDFGDSLIVELYENNFTSVLETPFDTNFANDIVRKIGNVKTGQSYTFQAWKMQKTDINKRPIEGKFVRGVSIKDAIGNKVEKHLTDEMQEKMLPMDTVSLYDASRSRKEQSNDFYKIYFKVLDSELKNRLVPYYKNIFSTWANENIVEQEASQGYHAPIIEQPRTQGHAVPFTVVTPQSVLSQYAPMVEDVPFPTLAELLVKNDTDDDLPF